MEIFSDGFYYGVLAGMLYSFVFSLMSVIFDCFMFKRRLEYEKTKLLQFINKEDKS